MVMNSRSSAVPNTIPPFHTQESGTTALTDRPSQSDVEAANFPTTADRSEAAFKFRGRHAQLQLRSGQQLTQDNPRAKSIIVDVTLN